jgi:hypothetical protein
MKNKLKEKIHKLKKSLMSTNKLNQNLQSHLKELTLNYQEDITAKITEIQSLK